MWVSVLMAETFDFTRWGEATDEPSDEQCVARWGERPREPNPDHILFKQSPF